MAFVVSFAAFFVCIAGLVVLFKLLMSFHYLHDLMLVEMSSTFHYSIHISFTIRQRVETTFGEKKSRGDSQWTGYILERLFTHSCCKTKLPRKPRNE